MNPEFIKGFLWNMTSFFDRNRKIKFTSRCIKYIVNVFSTIYLTEYDFICIWVRFQQYNSFFEQREDWITLSDFFEFICNDPIYTSIKDKLIDQAKLLSVKFDNKFGEVKAFLDMINTK